MQVNRHTSEVQPLHFNLQEIKVGLLSIRPAKVANNAKQNATTAVLNIRQSEHPGSS